MKHGMKYERLRETAVVSLLAHASVADAAQSIGISERGLRKWMAKEDFMEAVRTLRQQVLEAGASRLTGLVSKAIETLESALSSSKAADRIRASRAILEFRERMDKDGLQERVAALEKQLVELKNPGAPKVTLNGDVRVSVGADVIASVLAARRELQQRKARAGIIDAEPEPPALPSQPDE